MYLLVGFVLGLFTVRALALFAPREASPGPVAALRHWLLGSRVAVETQAPVGHLLTQGDADSEALVQTVEAEPVVPLADLKAEVTREDVEAIRRAELLEQATAETQKRFPNQDVAAVIAALVCWKPRRHTSEDKYQSSFRNHALKSGYAKRLEEKPRVRWGLEGDDPARAAYPDFVLGETDAAPGKKVLVELKANLKSSAEVDRAMGQMLRYLLAWKKNGPAILVICGEAPPEVRFLVRLYITSWRQIAKLPVSVYFKRDDVVPAEVLADISDEEPAQL